MAVRRVGMRGLAYMGSSAFNPPELVVIERAPKTTDNFVVPLGGIWVNPVTKFIYQLVNLESGIATWATVYSRGTEGQIKIGRVDGDGVKLDPQYGNIISNSSSIVVTYVDGDINLETTAVGASWTTVTGTTQALETGMGYIPNNAGLVTLTLPVAAVVGTEIKIMGLGVGGFKIAQNHGQTITHLTQTSTVGVAGYVASTDKYDEFTLRCAETDTHFRMSGVEGNITVV